jgi:hypothetical protein
MTHTMKEIIGFELLMQIWKKRKQIPQSFIVTTKMQLHSLLILSIMHRQSTLKYIIILVEKK